MVRATLASDRKPRMVVPSPQNSSLSTSANFDEWYGGGKPGCGARGPYCGDGVVEPAIEQCDDRRDLSTYNQSGCGPGCNVVPRCGDGRVDGPRGETCDDGNAVSHDGCSATCQLEIDVN